MTEDGELLSIIVPVYNNKKYLKQCIDSILSQEYKNVEIILVNDGSTDGSGKICDEYQNIDKRVQVIHQKNRGCICARQVGVQNSKGKYIGFVDSDDWIMSDMYQMLMSKVEKEKFDIVSMGYAIFDDKAEKKEDGSLFGSFEKGKNLDRLISNMMYDPEIRARGVQPSLCTKVFRRELLETAFNDIDSRVTMGEDAAIFYPCCLRLERIYIMKEYKYYYRVHSESMCRSMNRNTFSEIYYFYHYMRQAFLQYGEEYGLLKQLKKYLWTFIDVGLNQVFDLYVGMAYLFPYASVERDSNIILYGAGEVGLAYYEQLQKNHYCNVVAWIDKNGNRKNTLYPEQIRGIKYARIVIAVDRKEMADEIKNELIDIGIDRAKLVWVKPQKIPSVIL